MRPEWVPRPDDLFILTNLFAESPSPFRKEASLVEEYY